MWPTTEIRWFYRLLESPELPDNIWRWFQTLPGQMIAEQERVDHYLLLEGATDLGIKLREGRLEVKRRLAEPEPTVFGPRTAGQMEDWAKWGLVLTVKETYSFPQPGFPWQVVSKKRWLRKYRPGSEQSFPVQSSEPLMSGCELEVAVVQTANQDWWSLALESYGQTRDWRQALLGQVAARVLGTDDAPDLNAAASMSYPKWLAINGPSTA